ncbi:hypothetical protein ABOM_010961 [Aspergillus bombycis]|uniref:Uncharacterized protein n=1 Tax=Aspergillus bombycis TaxID=109264 RepID=A0A1F7ZMP2_9EURO|nr:hypothetical protein ABOM_010961 [Aspergillus bombycis]OGM40701.1 hypothetical protein ABOM_010961 [Aspergillus bombycis]
MRPALLRLLKRPSALSVLDSLISAPIGIEQLESRYKCECLRSYRQASRQSRSAQPVESEQITSADFGTRPARPPLSFRVYEIQAPQAQSRNSGQTNDVSSGIYAADSPRGLLLQPEKLEFESDIGHTNDIGSRLVDDPDRRHDFALWEELLRYRQRHYGDRGTLDIWEGLMTRVEGVQLPVSGDTADFFWQSFVELGLKQEVILKELADYAFELWVKTGRRWDRFYESIVGGFLERGLAQQAVEWHKRLRDPHLPCPNDVLSVLKPAINSSNPLYTASTIPWKPKRHLIPAGLRAFESICRATHGHKIYSQAISTVLQSDYIDYAPRIHKLLIERGDHPQSYEDIQPLIEHTNECGSPGLIQKLRRYASIRFPDQVEAISEDESDPRDELARQPEDQQSESRGKAWLEEKPFKDDFGARLFATKALRFEMILSGLRMFGVTTIGPQSLREMATRAHGCQDIADKLQELQKAGISVGDSVFVRLLHKLATENRDILLSDLLNSDQHPDVLEDAQLQESLLLSYYVARDWRPYNLTLAILGQIFEDKSDLANVHFRKFLAAGEWKMAIQVVDNMALRGATLSQESIDFIAERVLIPRAPGKPPRRDDIPATREIKFVSHTLRHGTSNGDLAVTELWVEVLKRLGMLNLWEELRKCCLWLARQYSSNSNTTRSIVSYPKKSQRDTGGLAQQHGDRFLRKIFSQNMQAAIVAWGFRTRVSQQRKWMVTQGDPYESLIPWVRGLVLLRELEKNGVHLSVAWIRRACRHRLAVLYGRHGLVNRRMNRMLRHENPYSVARVLGDINLAWGEPSLFGDREIRDTKGLVNPPNRTRRRRVKKMRSAYLQGAGYSRMRELYNSSANRDSHV